MLITKEFEAGTQVIYEGSSPGLMVTPTLLVEGI